MLKRQRAASPPVFPLEATLVSTPADFPAQTTKRRRVVAPVLDSAHRGWATPTGPSSYYEDSDEEYVSLDEEDRDGGGGGSGSRQARYGDESAEAGVPREYAAANHFLHDLHAQHQQRIQFHHPPSLTCTPSTSCSTYPNTPSHGYHSTQESSSRPEPTNQGSLPQPLPSGHLYGQAPSMHRPFSPAPSQSPLIGEFLDSEECVKVKERYEDTNKLLGNLFLHRRRELYQGQDAPQR